ncbi:MAG: ribosome-associated translation inhibitor RaiA [Clostridia bacterium]|nr:ribosome-associated translation inhibitor RaiA [Clostridia bacterium]MBQ6467068.1 ribosome-associated translation inhibitor RaiA [Clostridia bacterium]
MKLTITGRKCTPRDSFKEHAEKKLAKLEKFFGPDFEAKVTATVEKSSQSVEITVNHRNITFRSVERAENMNEALDNCVDNLIRQIRKNKTRIERKLRDTGFAADIPETGEYVDEELEYELVRHKSILLKPMSIEEAILQMNLVDHIFFMFLNEDNGNINVVYKRNDGGYGLLTPEVE